MSVTILPVRHTEESLPHLTFEARCLGCGHRWQAVSPEGVIDGLECPVCHVYKGILQGLFIPDEARFVCHCGCDAYYILADGCQCLQCGTIAKGF